MKKKVKEKCPKCHLINLIFDHDEHPMKCQFCGAVLEKELWNAKKEKRN